MVSVLHAVDAIELSLHWTESAKVTPRDVKHGSSIVHHSSLNGMVVHLRCRTKSDLWVRTQFISKDTLAAAIVWFISVMDQCVGSVIEPLEWFRSFSEDLKAALVEWVNPPCPEMHPSWVAWLPMPQRWVAQLSTNRFYDDL